MLARGAGRSLGGLGRCGFLVLFLFGALGFQFAHDGTLVHIFAGVYLQQRRSGFDDIAGFGQQGFHGAGIGRRNLDDGLVGFHRHQRLVRDDVIALGHLPGHDFSLGQALAEIGKVEYGHENSITLRTASSIRALPGM